jgi:hypothetical protein
MKSKKPDDNEARTQTLVDMEGEGAEGPIEEDTPVEVTKETYREFLYSFMGYVKAHRIYPKGHRRLKSHLKNMLRLTEYVHQERWEVSILSQPDAIIVSGETFANDPMVVDFAPELVKRLIRYVVIHRGVTIEELESLARLLIRDPVELQAAGGVHAVLDESDTPHILLIEFSYDMGNYAETDEDLEIVRTMARFEVGNRSEEYVLRRMGELGLNDEEHDKLGALVRKPEIQEKMESLYKLFRQMPSGLKTEMHTSDLIMYLVRTLTEAETNFGELEEEDASEIIFHILEQVRKRLMVTLVEKEEMPKRKILDQVARQTMSSPDTLLRWLSLEAEQLSVTLSSDQAGMIKAIFSKSGSSQRKIRFGDTQLNTLEVPDGQGENKNLIRKSHPQNAQEAESMQLWSALRERLGDRGFLLDLKRVEPAHIDILLEILRHEEEEKGRDRILKEVSLYLAQLITQEEDEILPSLSDLLNQHNAWLDDQALEKVLQTPPVCRRALREYIQGERRWYKILMLVVKTYEATFASALGSLLLETKDADVLGALEGFIPGCQDKLVGWLLNRMSRADKSIPLERIQAIALSCRTPRIVPLVEKLLDVSEEDSQLPLLQILAQVDDVSSVRLLCEQLDSTDSSRRESVIRMLGQCRNKIAESTLLSMLSQPLWKGARMQERMVVLASLRRCGTRASREVLERLGRNWFLLLTARGRELKEMARDTLIAIETRLKTQRSFSKEQRRGH